MKILVFSDSHGNVSNMAEAIDKNRDCDEIFYLGDGNSDIESIKKYYPKKTFTVVCGNCDFCYGLVQDCEYRRINHKTIYLTHGHIEGVKMSVCGLIDKAASVMADIALYGHTHFPETHVDQKSGIFVLNPGSIRENRYAILEIKLDGKISAELCSI